MIPAEFLECRICGLPTPGAYWATAVRSVQGDEFALDVNAPHPGCGAAGFDGPFQESASRRVRHSAQQDLPNSVLLQTNINHTVLTFGQLIKVRGPIHRH